MGKRHASQYANFGAYATYNLAFEIYGAKIIRWNAFIKMPFGDTYYPKPFYIS